MAWICTVNIKQHLSEREDPEGVALAANAIADELAHADVQDPVAFLAILGLPRFAQRLRTAGKTGDVAAVNGVLSALYDYADRHRIWLGLQHARPAARAGEMEEDDGK